MRPVLFLVSSASSYPLHRHLAAHLAAAGRRTVFAFEPDIAPAIRARLQADAAEIGADVREVAWSDALEPLTAFGRHPRKAAARVLSVLVRIVQAPGRGRLARLFWRSDLVSLREHRIALGRRLHGALRMLEELAPAAMVVSEDGISGPLPVLAAARHLRIPVIDLPYGYGVRRDLEIDLDNKAQRGAVVRPRGITGVLLRLLAPHWQKRGAYAGAIMFPSAFIVAAESVGITVRDAWTIHGGYADRLCAESRQMQRVYADEGIPADKVTLTGTPYCDLLVRGLERNAAAGAALRQPRKISGDRTRLLVAWPPSYHGERARFSEFPSYRELSLATLGWLSRLPACDVTVSLHPATLAEDREAVIATGVRLTGDYVIELIPQHDVFITYFSSTIRWAIAAGKPVVNFDLYHLGLSVYASAPGVRTVSSLAEFQQAVTELTASDSAFADWAARQIAVADEWGTLDGANTARIAAVIPG